MDIRFAFDPDAPRSSPVKSDPAAYVAREKTRDGTFVGIRSVGDGDRSRLAEGFARFVDPASTTALVATVWIDGCEKIVGLASSGRPGSEPFRAGVDVEVIEGWRDRGIESLLFTHLLRGPAGTPARISRSGCNPETDPVVLS